MRPSGRKLDELRSITIETNITKHAEGSCLIKIGDTHVLCTATVEDRIPPFVKGSGLGWVTAEYGMLPRSTGSRMRREASSGKQGGRTIEIQRLIGRSLRAGVDRVALGERQITVDCDVIQADGGTRCASITGGWVALKLAVNKLLREGVLLSDPLISPIAAISCGIYAGQTIADLDYAEDSEAGVDGNHVACGPDIVKMAGVMHAYHQMRVGVHGAEVCEVGRESRIDGVTEVRAEANRKGNPAGG